MGCGFAFGGVGAEFTDQLSVPSEAKVTVKERGPEEVLIVTPQT